MRRIVCAALAGMLQVAQIPPSMAGEVIHATITSLVFSPADIYVHPGDTIKWVNEDFVDHTATATSGEWDVAIPAGNTSELQLERAGTFPFYCRVHPGMTGTVHVITK